LSWVSQDKINPSINIIHPLSAALIYYIIIESQENVHVDHPGTSDFTSQTSPDLTSNTPRKKKIRRAYKYKKDQVQKLKKKLSFKKK
jgi:hypothetical protein